MTKNPSLLKNPEIDSWISFSRDGLINVRIGKVDIGQKISTAIERIVSEELDLDPKRIVMVMPDTILSPNEGMTSGSNSMEESGNAIRLAAATIRETLIEMASRKLNVSIASLEVTDGMISSRETDRTTDYWDLQQGRLFNKAINVEAKVKPGNLYGKSQELYSGADITNIVTGSYKFIQDVNLNPMLHARPVRPPNINSKLGQIDVEVEKHLKKNGITVIRNGSFLAVAGTDEYEVIKAADTVKKSAVWTQLRRFDSSSIFEQLKNNKRISLKVVDGMPTGAPPAADTKINPNIKSTYSRPYVMHASIAPSAAVAKFEENELEIWTHSQGIYLLRASLAELFHMPDDKIKIYHRSNSGCYGHNGADDAAIDAALIAKAVPGIAILLKWTRQDEHAWEPYSSAMVMELSANIDKKNKISSWKHSTFSDTHVSRPKPGQKGLGAANLLASRFLDPPIIAKPIPPNKMKHGGIHRNLEPLYRFENQLLIKNLVRNLPHRTSALRTLGAYANVFAIESFVDELAEEICVDAVELRLNYLSDQRAKACIKAVVKEIAHIDASQPNHGWGIGFAQYKNSKAYAAVAVHVMVNEAAEIKLLKAVIAADAGQIIDEKGVIAQLEGGFIQAASWTIYEEIMYDDENILSIDWESYPIIGFDNIPDFKTILISMPDEPFLGIGEAVCGPAAGAIGNAVFKATGLRVRQLPMTPSNLRSLALKT